MKSVSFHPIPITLADGCIEYGNGAKSKMIMVYSCMRLKFCPQRGFDGINKLYRGIVRSFSGACVIGVQGCWVSEERVKIPFATILIIASMVPIEMHCHHQNYNRS